MKTHLNYKKKDEFEKKREKECCLIFEMIDASCELAAERGSHPLEEGCLCIACVNKRKKIMNKSLDQKWKFRL